MNAVPEPAAAPDVGAPTIDERNPWLGLASFTEETREYFYGREEEVAELARRVQRKRLTVLFGQSGLGKTSILRAGLAPRLRAQGYCPVYVRIDYAREAPEPAAQIKQAIARTARRSGEWTQAGVAVEGESLWEFLHHRDDVLQDESGATLIPLLIFDQFEEIFTLAQTDDFGRARAARFIADLADLVENRPPRELEAKLEADESAAERFDFARSDYRVLIALREDYLAPLEGLKAEMPSITQNRLRLAPMTGKQALAAVTRPGKRLVSEEVAAAIVRFVAGGAELVNAEVEPSLLSLICRELNDTRLAQGRSEISLDLLAGSHESILGNFYERSLADQPAAVRRIIEDELLTVSGFRENVAEERVLGSFAAAGAGPAALAVLVNRRLLRIEERLDVRRVELTHDVLCSVVKSSRDLRREREAREATERLLADQRQRELAARRALMRARQVAAACAVLAIGAVVAAALAYLSTQRARRAEHLAEQTRGQAEHLLVYLTDDFAREMESSGRLDVVAELAKRQVDYFHALPPELKGRETTRNGALAMVYYTKAMRHLGNMAAAGAAAAEAVQLLDHLRQAGDSSEATTIGLALAIEAQSKVFDNENNPAARPTAAHAAELLKPLAERPGASVAVRSAYVEILVGLGFQQQLSQTHLEEAVRSLQLAMRIAAELGARELARPRDAAHYAEAGTWLVQALASLGRIDESRRVAADARAVASKVLELRPSYVMALHSEQVIDSAVADLEMGELHPTEALAAGKRSETESHLLIQLDPGNTISFNNLGATLIGLAQASWAIGHVRESREYFRQSQEAIGHAAQAGSWFVMNALFPTMQQAVQGADAGDAAMADAQLAAASRSVVDLAQSEPSASSVPVFARCLLKLNEARIANLRANPTTARRAGRESVSLVAATKPASGNEEFFRNICSFYGALQQGQAEYMLGDYAAAERTMRVALEARQRWPLNTVFDRRQQGEVLIALAMSLARQGRTADATQVINPVVQLHRELAARNQGDQWQHVELASALYAQALVDPPRRVALLKEAGKLVDSTPAEMRELRSVRLWRDRIGEALSKPAMPAARATAETL
jgi:AAA+ ATPase superfamily predicted ATPase